MRRWPYTFAVLLSAGALAWALIASSDLGVPMRDPDGFLGPAYVRLPLIGLVFFAIGIVPQGIRRSGFRHAFHGMVEIVRDEWTWKRLAYIATGLVTFYVSYVSYRNVKSYLPLAREGVLYDVEMLRLDHFVFFGNYPAQILHHLLGVGIAAEILAFVYVFWLVLVPVSLGAFLVWSKDISLGAWYSTALCLNWVLGALSYYAVPTLGPAFSQQSMFQDLPMTSASSLQQSLFKAGAGFKEDPTGSHIYGIAGFASLHTSVVVTACLFFYRSGQRRALCIVTYGYTVLVVLATLYFGWHFLADDVAGALIGWLAVSIGAAVTGNRGRGLRKQRRAAAAESAALAPATEPESELV